ncbi:unnamed protein product [Phytophthora lilii]|uniref:Unnamed protein product n=1 Tax=Phytophthora lilii TaxID=2077276 RepID=A0A9W6U5S5_9STRA|nr:unnamed protein product [Phytophthora lilii]
MVIDSNGKQHASPQTQSRHSYLASLTTRIKRSMATKWHRSQIGHRSEYSIERFLAFRDYYESTSMTHAIAVCALTPLPALLTALLIDCIPLRHPSEGWQANYGVWIRQFLAMFFESVGVVFQMREVVEARTISITGAVKIGLGTAVSSVLVTIIVADLWKFPIPFGFVFLINVYVLLFATSMILVIGPQVLKSSPTLRAQIKAQLFIIANQGVFIAKQNIANAAESYHEYVGPLLVFSVDLFNVYYVAICMESSTALATTFTMMVADSLHLVLSLRSVLCRPKLVQEPSKSNATQCVCYLEEISSILRNTVAHKSPQILHRRVRLLAPFPLRLSNDCKSMIRKLAKSGKFSNDGFASRRCSKNSISTRKASTLSKPSRIAKLHHRVTPTTLATVLLPQRGPILSDLIVSSGASIGIVVNSSRSGVFDGLQILFQSEYIILAEYIEFIVPTLYAPYLPALFHLPVAEYYPHTATLTSDNLSRAIINILTYAAIEFAGFSALVLLFKRTLGFSPLYQLAFVLETHAFAIQGHLFVWTLAILHLTLMHHGT